MRTLPISVVAGDQLSARQLHDLLRLRVDIFVVEQDCPYHEIDGRDLLPTTEHVWMSDDQGIAAALRLLDDTVGRRIGRVVTRADARGSGLSSALLEVAIERIGDDAAVLDAQAHLQDFYGRFGFVGVGEVFDEDGIPHRTMLRPSPAVA